MCHSCQINILTAWSMYMINAKYFVGFVCCGLELFVLPVIDTNDSPIGTLILRVLPLYM